MTAITNNPTSAPVELPPVQLSRPARLFAYIGQGVTAAYTVSSCKIQQAGSSLKNLIIRVMQAVSDFFAPKYQATRDAFCSATSSISLKLGLTKPAPTEAKKEDVTAPPTPAPAPRGWLNWFTFGFFG